MKTWSMQLGYPKKLIDNGMGRLFYLRKKGKRCSIYSYISSTINTASRNNSKTLLPAAYEF